MKTVGHNKSIRTINKYIVTIVAFVAVFIIAIAITEASGFTNFLGAPDVTNKNQNTTNNDDDEANSNDKKVFIENQTDNNTSPTVTSDNISFKAAKESDGSVAIETTLKNVSDGTCNIKIVSNDIEYSQSATILYQASFSTCAGFSIPAGALPDGNWKISLSVTSKNITITKTTDIEVK